MDKHSKDGDKKGGEKPVYKRWWFWLIVAVVAIIMIASTAKKPEADNEGDTKPSEQATAKISQDDAENYCQDAALLRKYINLDKVAVISISNYNAQYGEFGGYYDSEGNDVMYMRWNGKNKDTGELVNFDCWISGKSKDDIKLHYLEVGGVGFNDTRSMTIYDKAGALVYAQ